MLEELLKRAQQYDIDTASFGNTNHLPMALIALDKLGADENQLEDYFSHYASHLVPLSNLTHTAEFDWRDHLGETQLFNDYLNYFETCIHKIGAQQTLTSHIDPLILGCGAAAFHALIRLSYGIQSNNSKEVAFGLAYLASHYFPVETPQPSDLNLKQIVDLALTSMADKDIEGRLISGRMKSVCTEKNFSSINLTPKTLDLKTLSECVAQLYLQTNDFTVLHAVTSCHALRYVLPYVNQQTRVLRHYWSSVLVAVLSVSNLKFDLSKTSQQAATEPTDLTPVLESKDSHVIKLVWSCLDEYQHYGLAVHLDIIGQMLSEES